MGSSNWQNVPFHVDALRKIRPRRVLDIGMDAGRWGLVVRECQESWTERDHGDDRPLRLEAIAAAGPEPGRAFYDQVHTGDPVELLPGLDERQDVILCGSVLEGAERETARRLLGSCLDHADYVLVDVRLGSAWSSEDAPPGATTRTIWEAADFREFDLVREQQFHDHEGRPFGSFVLSRRDPKGLAGSLFPGDTPAGVWTGGIVGLPVAGKGDARARELRLEEVAFELEFLKNCRPVRRLFKRPNRVVRSLGRWRKSGILVRALGERDERSEGTRVALLSARSELVHAGLPWYFVDGDESWILREHAQGQYGRALVTDEAASLRFILRGHVPLLRFESSPRAGKVEITRRGTSHTLDLYSPTPGTVEFDPKSNEILAGHASSDAGVPAPDSSELEGVLGRLQRAGAEVLAVCVDSWLGVGNATRTLFEHTVSLPQNLSDTAIEQWSGAFLTAGVRHLVLSGVTPSHLRLAQRLRERDPAVVVDTLWHSSPLQTREDYVWKVFQQMIEGARDGALRKVGFVKKGMEEWAAALGVRSGLLLNHVPAIPDGPSTPDEGGIHAGLWISWEGYRKLPYTMIAAARMVPNVVLRGAGLSRRAMEFIEFNGLDAARVRPSPLPADQLAEHMRGCHLSLYVTLSECCPMLPLESLSLGVPCLVGPNSHLFEDDEVLRELLIVPYPERAEVIARSMQRLVEARREAVEAYRRWAPGYNESARASVSSFLADD